MGHALAAGFADVSWEWGFVGLLDMPFIAPDDAAAPARTGEELGAEDYSPPPERRAFRQIKLRLTATPWAFIDLCLATFAR